MQDILEAVNHIGAINDQIISKLLLNIKQRLKDLSIDKRTLKSIYSVSVELIENIQRHGAYSQNDEKYGEVSFHLSEEKIFLKVKNVVSDEDRLVLEKRFFTIKDKPISIIKELYRDRLINGQISDRGGAGLGIYVMAIKSENNYNYQFEKVEGNQDLSTYEIASTFKI